MNAGEPQQPSERADLLIVGAGAAGLAAAIAAGESARDAARRGRIVVLEGARKPGAKILVSGGGRCNVTHAGVRPEDFCGGPRPIIRNVLRAFDERATIDWMARLGVPLKLEATGKYFPVSDQARSVLDALFDRLRRLGVECRAGARVTDLRACEDGFELDVREFTPGGAQRATTWRARRVIVATGGLALPKSGSDGAGLEWMRRLGHTIVPTTPALVALVLRPGPTPGGRFAELSGLSLDARLTLYESGKRLAAREGSMLFTHFGLSGPVAMDLSRHWLRARLERPGGRLELCMSHADFASPQEAESWLREAARRDPRRRVASLIAERWPARWAAVLAGDCGAIGQLTRARRRALALDLSRLALEVERDRGYGFAEATAGGVSLREIDPRTMRSRLIPNLFLCGEILDVDGTIGGFNFQWAWSSGYVAGRAAMREEGKE